VYNFPEPPYFLLFVGLFAGLTCGAAFEATLKQKVREWSKNRSTRTLAQMKGFQLLIPFLGTQAVSDASSPKLAGILHNVWLQVFQ
jgi:hypothetical protein